MGDAETGGRMGRRAETDSLCPLSGTAGPQGIGLGRRWRRRRARCPPGSIDDGESGTDTVQGTARMHGREVSSCVGGNLVGKSSGCYLVNLCMPSIISVRYSTCIEDLYSM